ncbi:hypothetical protein [Pontibacter sp. G13]|uniref:hypothetical protein n=1 Tax=Pontibacter sp. G13 TaxID=3074898 RepID=UPI00288B2DCA|nr:hypothetical protein [Pontibacter sp. G13]WNJ17499.1 hypothetical protein RJD25_21840 [Pontibacter sp. G13]
MDILATVLILFAVLESLNILILYFWPGTTKGNGVGVFDAFEQSKAYPDIHALIRYLINWIAGSKLIFVALLIVIAVQGDRQTQLLSLGALMISIGTFYWRLYPLIRSMDRRGQISPSGYSKTLGLMIAGMLCVMCMALAVYLLSA